MTKPIHVLLVDDHEMVRAGLRQLLLGAEGIEIVEEAADARGALSAIENQEPQVVLLDLNLPGVSGLEVVQQVCRKWPAVRIIMLSVHAEEELVIQALRAGAAGYLLKDAGADELKTAIRHVADGGTYVAPNLSKQIVSYLHRTEQNDLTLAQLTPRQREVLQLIAEGFSNKEIARKLDISAKTVETHRMQVMERLDIHDIAGLTRFAIRVGLVKSDL